ncbi:MAG TPA: NAD(P)H-dependent oxidoreductase [Candidatus Paceibacterota bacterium]|nr:NAD(P)H-dependent oxidoreductase [Candidatus Paceibacterota bacterium]HRZ57127.1 NAD(P)H-dependent oxidoreductase [Candidatus Paceibacterota bacterium]
MKVLVIVAHPSRASFNHAIAAACLRVLTANGHEVIAHDLYEEQFNPLLPYGEFSKGAVLPAEIQRHCNEVSQADGIIIVHPNWWGQPPAILKGWVDRVIRPGVAYEFLEGDKGEGVPRGLLKAKSAIIFNTSNTESTREETLFGDPLEAIWKNCIFALCGVLTIHRRMFNIVVTSSEAERKGWLAEVAATIDRFFPKGLNQQAMQPNRQVR